jgi:hypothetical protein
VLKRVQKRLQLILAVRLIRGNVEDLDWLIRFVGKLPERQAFNLCSNELTWGQLLNLVPHFICAAALRRRDPPFTL